MALTQADEIKTLLLCYWRFSRGCPYIATEFEYGAADVIAASPSGQNIYETEVKISVGDMKKELGKRKHQLAQSGFWGKDKLHLWANYFYFAVPSKIQVPAIALIVNYFPYAGLLLVEDYADYLKDNDKPYQNVPISEVKKPARFETVLPTQDTLARLSRGMSNTLCSRSYQLLLLNRKRKAGQR